MFKYGNNLTFLNGREPIDYIEGGDTIDDFLDGFGDTGLDFLGGGATEGRGDCNDWKFDIRQLIDTDPIEREQP